MLDRESPPSRAVPFEDSLYLGDGDLGHAVSPVCSGPTNCLSHGAAPPRTVWCCIFLVDEHPRDESDSLAVVPLLLLCV